MSLSRIKTFPLKTLNPFLNISIYRSLSSSPSPSTKPPNNNKPLLSLLFQEAVGLSQKTETYPHLQTQKTNEIKEKLFELEKDVRVLKKSEEPIQNFEIEEKPKKSKSLHGLFARESQVERRKKTEEQPRRVSNNSIAVERKRRAEEPRIFKELSDEMRMFLTHLYEEGYFRDANFLTRDKLDFDCFNDTYGRDFVKFAAEKFGKDKQDIAKWLSGSDLKKVALFGCPSLGRKTVLSSKRLRLFFGIKEDTVCSKCVLKQSCHLVNQSVQKDSKTLNLADVMRVITIYSLEASHPELSVLEEIKASVSRLLVEILKLSQTTS